jgi:hypothetical protein
VSCRRLQRLSGLEEFRGLRMEPGFRRAADELLTGLVLKRRLSGLTIGPRQGGQRRDVARIGAQALLGQLDDLVGVPEATLQL